MALTPAQLNEKVDLLQTTVDETQSKVANVVQTWKDANKALQDIIDAGSSDGEALQAIGDKVDAAITDLATTLPPSP